MQVELLEGTIWD